MTVRQLMRAARRYKTTAQAKAALAGLVAAGLAERRLRPARGGIGRPVEVFEAK